MPPTAANNYPVKLGVDWKEQKQNQKNTYSCRRKRVTIAPGYRPWTPSDSRELSICLYLWKSIEENYKLEREMPHLFNTAAAAAASEDREFSNDGAVVASPLAASAPEVVAPEFGISSEEMARESFSTMDLWIPSPTCLTGTL